MESSEEDDSEDEESADDDDDEEEEPELEGEDVDNGDEDLDEVGDESDVEDEEQIGEELEAEEENESEVSEEENDLEVSEEESDEEVDPDQNGSSTDVMDLTGGPKDPFTARLEQKKFFLNFRIENVLLLFYIKANPNQKVFRNLKCFFGVCSYFEILKQNLIFFIMYFKTFFCFPSQVRAEDFGRVD